MTIQNLEFAFNLKNGYLNFISIIDDLINNLRQSAEFANIKLIKPVVPKDKRIGISNIEEIIDEHFTINCKWTIMRDINGYCLDKYLVYHSTVIDMDSYNPTHRKHVRDVVRQAISTGLWVTFSFKDTICTIHELLLQNVLPADILNPAKVFDDFSMKHIFDEKADRGRMMNSKLINDSQSPFDSPRSTKKTSTGKPSVKINKIEK